MTPQNKEQTDTGLMKIDNNLEKSFKGTINSAFKNGYFPQNHYVIVDWCYYHELLAEDKLLKLSREFLINTGIQSERARILGIIKSFDFDKYISIGINEKGKLDDDDMIFTDEGLKELTSKIKGET